MSIPNSWAYGCDLSEHQGNFNPANKKQLVFVKQRVTQADGRGAHQDKKLEQLYAQLVNVPLLGAWTFWSGFQPLITQADMYLEAIANKRYSWHALDWEIHNKAGQVINPNTKVSADSAYAWIEFIRDQTGKKVLLYIQRSDYADLKALGVTWLKNVEIWFKYYPFISTINQFNPLSLDKYIDNRPYKFLQYGAGDVGANVYGYQQGKEYGVDSVGIDLDVFRGTKEELYQWIGVLPPAPPPLTELQRITNLENDMAIVKQKLGL